MCELSGETAALTASSRSLRKTPVKAEIAQIAFSRLGRPVRWPANRCSPGPSPRALRSTETLCSEVTLLDNGVGPDRSEQFLLYNNASPILNQNQQGLNDGGAQWHRLPLTKQYAAKGIQPEGAEFVEAPRRCGGSHSELFRTIQLFLLTSKPTTATLNKSGMTLSGRLYTR